MRIRFKLVSVLAGVALAGTLALPAAASARPGPLTSDRHQPGMPVAQLHPATPAMLRSAGLLPAADSARQDPLSSNYFDWNNDYYTSQCIRDPSGGGAGTTVLNSGCDASDAEDWEWAVSYYCSGGVVTSNCPGGPISADFRGAALITWRNLALGFATGCFHTNDSTSWTAVMVSSCGDASTSYVVLANYGGSGQYAFVSVKADTEDGCLYYLDDDGASNSALFADEGQNAVCTTGVLYVSQEWQFTSS